MNMKSKDEQDLMRRIAKTFDLKLVNDSQSVEPWFVYLTSVGRGVYVSCDHPILGTEDYVGITIEEAKLRLAIEGVM